MKLSRTQKTWIIVGSLLIVLISTNPSRSDFKDFLGYPSGMYERMEVKRERNYFVCSVYSSMLDGKYIGFAGNFYEISPSKTNEGK